MTKPFASSADMTEKVTTLEEIADGVYAYTAQGDPNLGAIVTDDGVVAVEAGATPAGVSAWIARLRELTAAPIRFLVLTHYHAVRVLGASAFDAEWIVAHDATRDLVAQRGEMDFESEARRFPRLFAGIDSVPGLTWPTVTFAERMTLHLGGREIEVRHLGRGHTAGDAVVWLPDERVLFSGDLVEAEAAPYTGDAYLSEWRTGTLDAVTALGAKAVVPGRGPTLHGDQVADAIATTREFLTVMCDRVAAARETGGSLKDAFEAAHAALAPRFAGNAIFDHCLPFNVARAWDELDGREPVIWTAQRDREVWDLLYA
jgi:glyoxylase-like metal-dependent hydrolase (beta-lactamase superfamily II)